MSDQTAERHPGAGRVPVSTYRLQLNHRFTFRDAADVVPYLAELGVSDLYASPYLEARPGSVHGYDITNHERLNPEIGTEEEHARMTSLLREHGMGHLLDIVPNHMGIAGGSNPWWNDVLENGPSSPYSVYFDIDWKPYKAELEGKVLLPVLGGQYGEVLEKGELKLVYGEGRFHIDYYETRFPCAPGPTAAVLRLALERLEGVADDHPDRMELESIVTALERLPARRRTDAESVAERRREKTVTQRRLGALYGTSAEVSRALDRAVEEYNGTPGEPHSFDRLDALLEDQAYRLAFWRVAAEEINYRRFFDVNDLAGVRVERGEVFQATHRLILRLVHEGKVTGLRIDHPDGLFHPRDYLRDLQVETVGLDGEEPFYVLVEKILTGEETLPEDWPVAGTVGYEFMSRVGGLFVARGNEAALDLVFRRFARERIGFADLVYDKKRVILDTSLVSELTVLTNMLGRISERNRRSRDFTPGLLHDALREVVASFPVYRTYIDAFAGEVSERDAGYVEHAVRLARRRNPGMSRSLFEFVRSVLLLRWPDGLDAESREEHARFVMKFQQLTGPVMAKGVEDTSFYIFNRLVSLNEVGGEPDRFGMAPEELHAWLAERAERWPHALSASSTHDTKRSEDVRARIAVLSEVPELWEAHVTGWAELNRGRKRDDEGRPVPDAGDEYLLYQTLVGAWPLGATEDQAHQDFVARLQGYMEKATREAKEHTSWIEPNAAYDAGLKEFVAAILDRAENAAFLDDLARLQPLVARMGMVNALAQTLVKLAAPGVPDVYQGQELWDFSLVDPDNRRPVDYGVRRRLLAELRAAMEGGSDPRELARELVERWEDGRIKMYLTHRALTLRRTLPELFRDGEYLPLEPAGERAEHVFAFARRGGGTEVVAVVPRLVATLMRERGFALPAAEDWRGTRITGGGGVLEGRWRNVLTGEEVEGRDGALAVDELLGSFPVALLERA